MLLNNTQTDLLKLLHYKIGDMFVDIDNNSYTILKVGEERNTSHFVKSYEDAR